MYATAEYTLSLLSLKKKRPAAFLEPEATIDELRLRDRTSHIRAWCEEQAMGLSQRRPSRSDLRDSHRRCSYAQRGVVCQARFVVLLRPMRPPPLRGEPEPAGEGRLSAEPGLSLQAVQPISGGARGGRDRARQEHGARRCGAPGGGLAPL